MERPWEAELRVSEALAAQLIEAQFPELAPVHLPLDVLGEGWDNVAYLVGGDIVFRFPRRQIAVDFIEKEYRLLPILAPRLPLPIPLPEYLGRPSEAYPWPFLGYRRLPGETACRARLDDAQRAALAAPLGAFLAALHAFPVEEARRLGTPPDTIGKLDLGRIVPELRERLEKMVALGLVADRRPCLAAIEASAGLGPSGEPRLVHGDFYVRHLLVGGDRRLCGVIDWGDLHLGDPAVDLLVAHAFLPPEAHAAFRRAYGEIPEDRWRLARVRAMFHSAALVLYGHDIGDEDLLREGLRIFAATPGRPRAG